MIQLSDGAKTELDAYFEGKEQSAVRIYLAAGGCSGPRLALALDKPETDDDTFESNGYTFCINQELMKQVEGVTIDFSFAGFSVDSKVPLPGGGGSGCGGCGGGCSS